MGREGVVGSPFRVAKLEGMLTKNNTIRGEMPVTDRTKYSLIKYKFILDAPFDISERCCTFMKKKPAHQVAKIDGKYPITAQMASESRLRRQKWIANGCNAFNVTNPISNPMSFWTEQDVLQYIHEHNLEIAEPYGDVIVVGDDGFEYLYNIFDKPRFDTTRAKRTGCVFCGFGAHNNNDRRFEMLSESHPKLFDYVMRGGQFVDGLWKPSNEGLGYWFVFKWIMTHSNIKYIVPDIDKYEEKYGTEETRRLLYKERINGIN